MSRLTESWSNRAPLFLGLLRVVSSAIFVTFGTTLLFAFPVGVPPNGGTVPLLSQAGIGGALELVGGALLLVGLFTRPVAFLLAGEMAVAYFQFHAGRSFWPSVNEGVPAILYCFVFLYLSAAGPGAFALDNRRRG